MRYLKLAGWGLVALVATLGIMWTVVPRGTCAACVPIPCFRGDGACDHMPGCACVTFGPDDIAGSCQ